MKIVRRWGWGSNQDPDARGPATHARLTEDDTTVYAILDRGLAGALRSNSALCIKREVPRLKPLIQDGKGLLQAAIMKMEVVSLEVKLRSLQGQTHHLQTHPGTQTPGRTR